MCGAWLAQGCLALLGADVCAVLSKEIENYLAQHVFASAWMRCPVNHAQGAEPLEHIGYLLATSRYCLELVLKLLHPPPGSFACDRSFGVLLWEIATGEMPRRGKIRDLVYDPLYHPLYRASCYHFAWCLSRF